MLIKTADPIPSSDITNERLYLRRREFIRLGAGLAGAAAGGGLAACGTSSLDASTPAPATAAPQTPITDIKKRVVTTSETLNKYEEITGYNNYYEFGTGKSDPARRAGQLKTSPWTVKIDGLCNKPGDYHLEDLIKTADLEERVYRHSCVDACTMVIIWLGMTLATITKHCGRMTM